jgi:predicted nucleic-acid-binding protein
MTSVDTNVIVRLVTNDDVAQARRALALFDSEEVYVPKTVLLEVEWVLRSAYGLDRGVIRAALEGLVGLATVHTEDPPAVSLALHWYGEGIDLADGLHIASTPESTPFATFDRTLVRRAKRAAPGRRLRGL